MRAQKYISTLLACVIISSTASAYAEPTNIPPAPEPVPGELDVGAAISPMRKGQTAPFTGVLLSPKAVTTIIVEQNSVPEKIQIEVDKTRKEEQVKCDFKVIEITAPLITDKKILEASQEANKKQINLLTEELKKSEDSRPNVVLWTGLGFVGGIAVTVLTVFAVSAATK